MPTNSNVCACKTCNCARCNCGPTWGCKKS